MHRARRALLVLCSLPLLALGGLAFGLASSDGKGESDLRAVVEGWLEDADLLDRSRATSTARGEGRGKTKTSSGSTVERALDLLERREAALGLLALGLLSLFAGIRRRGGDAHERDDSDATAPGGARGTTPPSRSAARRARRVAATIEAREGPEHAGEFLIAQGLPEDAVDLFLREGLQEAAAELLHDQNRFSESAELYEKAGRMEAAAAIFAQIDRFADAARCYLAVGKGSVAAEMFERGGKHAEAGRCYRESGFRRHAAEAFFRAGSKVEAADELVAVFNEEERGLGGQTPQQKKERGKVARKAGQLLTELERLDEAERILVRAELWEEAAEVALAAGEHARAADLFARAGRSERAADMLDQAGDEKAAARLRGECLRDRGEHAEAAELLEKGEEYGAAGDLFRTLQRHDRAARCYEAAGNPSEAAEMYRAGGELSQASAAYQQAGQLVEAAKCADEGGDPARSAELLESAGRVFDAGQAYAEIDRGDDAIRLLQQIEPDDPQFTQAATKLGQLFRGKGMHSLSVKKFQQAIGDTPISRQTVEAHYDLARAFEDNDDLVRAIEAFERILTFDYHFQDVADRLEQAKETFRLQTTERPRSATPGGSGGTNRYRLIRELGRGGMGVVYLARDTVLERDVAFKVLPEEVRNNPGSLRNFFREAKAAAKLNHPHIVTVYDAGRSEHGFYLAMEYVEGSTLKDILRRRGPIPVSGVVYVLRQMSDALAYAHRKKVVHRDIKTSNTMWTPAKKVKIMDFGVAKLLEEVRNQTTLVSGTPFYMSPQQTLGQPVDHRTDLYSLGVTLYELCTGELPFHSGNVPYHHVHTPAPDPRQANADLPDFLARIILRCLQKDPDDRFARAEEIAEELDRAAKAGAAL
jgi:tetratricopeptide (TPR) repeat protein